MVEYHADDFGFFPRQSRRIIEAADEGAVNAISIIVNSEYYVECIDMLGNRPLKTALHLNIVSGRPVSEAMVDILTNKDGEFGLSFMTLLIVSYNALIRDRYKSALKAEILAQIRRYSQFFSSPLRIDSHCHFHMIPVVFDALIEVIRENDISVEYIRFPAEKLLPGVHGFVRPVNLVKTVVLDILCLRNRNKHSETIKSMEKRAFFGILHSGCLNINVVRNIQKHIEEDCEILFHPGGCYEIENLQSVKNTGDLRFWSSEDRNKELQLLKTLRAETENVENH